MRMCLLLIVLAVVVGCDEKKSTDPNIKAERTIIHPGGGGHVGPVGGGYDHGAKQEKYEGPVSKAPAWAK